MIEYGWPLAAPRTLAERIAEMTEAARYLHGDLLDLAADLDAAEVEVEPGSDATTSAMRPIDLADVRKGDRVRIITEGVVKDAGADWGLMEPDSCAESWYLLDRPDPDAERAEQLRDALIAITGQPLRYLGSISTDEIRAALKAARLTIEPRPTTGDLHA
jgi:hypothetical protein